jgi:putative DNA primase/helicase
MTSFKRDIKSEFRGKWASVGIISGIEKKIFNGKHQPCPRCKAGKDRFRWNTKKEFGFCNQCGDIQPIDLLIEHLGLPFKETAEYIRKITGDIKLNTIKPVDNAAELKKAHDRLKFIHKGLKPISPNGVVAKYLAKRGITVLPEKDVYEHNNIAYYGTPPDGKTPVSGVFNAMVSRVTDIESKMTTYHITYLSEDGKKIDFAEPKIIAKPIQDSKGSSIKLFQPKDMLGIAEGIETALSCYATDGFPMWAASNAYGMKNIQIPESVKHVLIYVDEDRSYTGQAAAYSLANRLTVREGKQVRVIRLIDTGKGLEQYCEQGLDADFNDYILSQTIRDRKTA